MRTEMLRNQPMAHKDNLSRDIVPRVMIIQAIYKKSATSAACKLISFIGMAGWAFTKIALNSTALSFCEKSSWWISNLVFYFLTTSAFMILPGTNTCDSVFQCSAGSTVTSRRHWFIALRLARKLFKKESSKGSSFHITHIIWMKFPLTDEIFE